jgi:hypothetical protein
MQAVASPEACRASYPETLNRATSNWRQSEPGLDGSGFIRRVTLILWDLGFPRGGSVIREPIFRNRIDLASFISVLHSGFASWSGFCEIAETAGLAMFQFHSPSWNS